MREGRHHAGLAVGHQSARGRCRLRLAVVPPAWRTHVPCSVITRACSSPTAMRPIRPSRGSARGSCGLGCWAHARRYFFEAAAERPKTAERILRLIARAVPLGTYLGQTRDRRSACGLAAALLRAAVAPAATTRPGVAQTRTAEVRPGSGVPLSARTRAPLDRAPESQRHPARQTPDRKCHPALGDRQKRTGCSSAIPTPASAPRSFTPSSSPASAMAKTRTRYLRDVLTRLPRMTNHDDLAALTPARWQPAT